MPADVADADSVAALFAGVRERFGRLDLLVNNAGTGARPARWTRSAARAAGSRSSAPTSPARSCARTTRSRMMKAQRPMGGRIINNGSISAHAPRPRSVGYTVTKHAITGLTKSISLDGRPYNIACGQIDIGNANTAMTERIAAGRAAGGRVGQGGADVRPAARGGRGGVHGRAAARRQRPVPDDHRDDDAVHRPRLMAGRGRRRVTPGSAPGPRTGTYCGAPGRGGIRGPLRGNPANETPPPAERVTPQRQNLFAITPSRPVNNSEATSKTTLPEPPGRGGASRADSLLPLLCAVCGGYHRVQSGWAHAEGRGAEPTGAVRHDAGPPLAQRDTPPDRHWRNGTQR